MSGDTCSGPCVICGVDSKLRCTGCVEGPFYCAKEHQKKDWKAAHRYVCGTNDFEKCSDPDYGTIYKAKRPIASGIDILRRKPILSFPRRFNAVDFDNSPYPALFAVNGPTRADDMVACLDCCGMMAYKTVLIDDKGVARLHACLKCDWPIHQMECGNAHDKECGILKSNNIKWADFKHNSEIYFIIAVLRAVLLKKDSSPNFNTLMSMPSKPGGTSRRVQGYVHSFIDKCKLGSVVTNAELFKLVEIICSNFYTCNHRGCYNTKYALIIFDGAHGRGMSHSCMANCIVRVDPNTLVGTFTTARAVEAGEVLTINYDNLLAESPFRGSKSRLAFLTEIGVKCECPRCTTCTENGTLYNAIRCQSDICKNEKHYMVPIRQTPEDCLNQCLNPNCKKLVNHGVVAEAQAEVMRISQQFVNSSDGLRLAMPSLLDLLHPNHFLVLRAQLRICMTTVKMILRPAQYFKDSEQTILKPSSFNYYKHFLDEFSKLLAAIRMLNGGCTGAPPTLLFPHTMMRIQKLAKEILAKPADSLDNFTAELEGIKAEQDLAVKTMKNDPMQTKDETNVYMGVYHAHQRYLLSAVKPRILSWDEAPPIFRQFILKESQSD